MDEPLTRLSRILNHLTNTLVIQPHLHSMILENPDPLIIHIHDRAHTPCEENPSGIAKPSITNHRDSPFVKQGNLVRLPLRSATCSACIKQTAKDLFHTATDERVVATVTHLDGAHDSDQACRHQRVSGLWLDIGREQ